MKFNGLLHRNDKLCDAHITQKVTQFLSILLIIWRGLLQNEILGVYYIKMLAIIRKIPVE